MGKRKKGQNKEVAYLEKNQPLARLLSAIKSDDERLFSEIVATNKTYLNLCFGRFPLLSLCYLYKSKKIAAVYEKSLLNFSAYTFTDEDDESYKLFRAHAKRCLRFYIYDNSIVSPLEMLAIMGESLYLTQKYGDAQKDAKTVSRIQDIYRMRHAQNIDISNSSIDIARKPLSRKQKYRIIAAVVVVALVAGLCGASWWGLFVLGGRGTADNPYNIYGEKQLQAAMEKNAHIKLAKDFSLTQQWQPLDFSGSIDGMGHTVFVTKNNGRGLMSVLSGRIENINFVFEDLDMEIAENSWLVTKSNSGLMSGINVKVTGRFATKSLPSTQEEPAEAVYLSLLAYENTGEIINCKIDANVTCSGAGGYDAFLSAISLNSGAVKECKTFGEFVTDTVDVAALVAENKAGATVMGCINNAKVSQSTNNANWLPNVGGVALLNYGTVADCINNGAISSQSTVSDKILDVYAGGIVCINFSKIIKSKNNADISAQSQDFNVYAGGVAAFNSSVPFGVAPSIENSCSYGKIAVSSHSETGPFLFAGGIVGYLRGSVVDSYSSTVFSTTSENAIIGGISGVAEYNAASADNNFYVEQENVSFGHGSVLSFNTLYKGADDGVTKVASIEEIKTKEVYWE